MYASYNNTTKVRSFLHYPYRINSKNGCYPSKNTLYLQNECTAYYTHLLLPLQFHFTHIFKTHITANHTHTHTHIFEYVYVYIQLIVHRVSALSRLVAEVRSTVIFRNQVYRRRMWWGTQAGRQPHSRFGLVRRKNNKNDNNNKYYTWCALPHEHRGILRREELI